MSTNWFLNNWSFPPNEEALLYWISSPYKEKDQFWIDLIFQQQQIDETGKVKKKSFRIVKESLGLLPGIRFGSVFKNGRYVREHNNSKDKTIDFPSNVKYGIEIVRDCIQPHIDLPDNNSYFSELCLVIYPDNEKKIIIPCMEIIRFFFAPNELLTYEILTKQNLMHINKAKEYDINNRCLTLNFPNSIAPAILTPSVIRKIAFIIIDPDWSYSFNEISNERRGDLPHQTIDKIIPLKCIPPTLKNSKWRTKILETDHHILVSKIIGVRAQKKLPFSKLIAYHPNKYEFIESKPDPDDDTLKVLDVPTRENEILADPSNPQNHIRPNMLSHPTPSLGITYTSSYKLLWKIDKQKNKNTTIKRPNGTINITAVSVNDKGGIGNTQAGEFDYHEIKDFADDTNYVWELELNPLTLIGIPDGLLGFCETILSMNLETYYKIGESDDIKYALIYLNYGGISVFLIELDTKQSHSTLIFRTKHPIPNIQEAIYNLVSNNYKSSWNQKELKKNKDFKINFARHVHQDIKKWAKQLNKKIN